jgi:enterochelin esterase-like enzyme
VVRIRNIIHVVAFAAALDVSAAFAQQPPAPPLLSPEVASDRRVTFRFQAPNAKEVVVALEGAERQPMQKDEKGVWTLTTHPLEPDLYGYSFVADGVRLVDPQNSSTKPNLLNLSSMVHVPGPSSLPWEVNDVPRGAVQHHFYKSAAVGDQRDFYVYTPPGYDPTASRTYPVFYLLHGYSDDASGWTAVGRAHVILDNLIAQGKARPMIVVMPLGYGAPEIVAPATAAFRDAALRKRSFDKFRDSLFNEVVPFVEKNYRAAKDRGGRAIAGLSMGGAESMFIGLNAIDRFAWIGAFSAGGLDADLGVVFPKLDSKTANSQLRGLWIACGTADRLIDANRATHQWLDAKGIRHTWVETEGAHTWMVWRRNLATFASLLFKES